MEFRIPECLTDADKNVTLPLASLLLMLGKLSDAVSASHALMSEVRSRRGTEGNFSLERKAMALNDHIFDMLADMNDMIPKKPIYGPMVVDLLRERPAPAACLLDASFEGACCASDSGLALLLAARAIEKATAPAPLPPASSPAADEEEEDLYA